MKFNKAKETIKEIMIEKSKVTKRKDFEEWIDLKLSDVYYGYFCDKNNETYGALED